MILFFFAAADEDEDEDVDVNGHADAGSKDTLELVGERKEHGKKQTIDMAGPYADILRNAFGQQQQQHDNNNNNNDDDDDDDDVEIAFDPGLGLTKSSESSTSNDTNSTEANSIKTNVESTQSTLNSKFIRQWHRASPTFLITNTKTKTKTNTNININIKDTLIVLAHSSADELVGWRQVDVMERALMTAGWTVVRDGKREGKAKEGKEEEEEEEKKKEGEGSGNTQRKRKGKGKTARIIDIKGGGDLGHDEIWQGGKALAGIIAKSVRWVM